LGARGDILVPLSSVDINSDDAGLRMTVLAGLRCGNVDNLAWEALNHDVGSLLEFT